MLQKRKMGKEPECHGNHEFLTTGPTQDWPCHYSVMVWEGLVRLHPFPLNYWLLTGLERRGKLSFLVFPLLSQPGSSGCTFGDLSSGLPACEASTLILGAINLPQPLFYSVDTKSPTFTHGLTWLCSVSLCHSSLITLKSQRDHLHREDTGRKEWVLSMRV